jgi:AcrR family transcriptional regulator
MARRLPRSRRPVDSRDALLAAATDEFALKGFDGASVDTIAARAGVNKAMIYYHFKSKERLYLEILGGVFAAVGERTGAIAASDAPADEKIVAFVAALSATLDARPYLPAIMMREVAEGARRLDTTTLRLMSRLFNNLHAILDQGTREGVFRPLHPLLAYFSLISPMFFFRAAAPVRSAMDRHHLVEGVAALDNGVFLAHLTGTILHVLEPDRPTSASARRPAKTTRQRRSGDHA